MLDLDVRCNRSVELAAPSGKRYHVIVSPPSRGFAVSVIHFTDLGDAQRYEDKVAAQNLYVTDLERCDSECVEATL